MKVSLFTIIRLLAFILLVNSSKVFAWCTSVSSPIDYSYSLASSTLTVPANLAPGTALGSVISLSSGPSKSFKCSAGQVYILIKLASDTAWEPSDFPGIYKTNVPGIGVKFWDTHPGSGVVIEKDVKVWYPYYIFYQGQQDGGWLFDAKMQFYVIGKVETGDVKLSGPTIEVWANTASNTTENGALYNRLNVSGTVKIQSASCETPDITVNLGKNRSSDIPIVGSTSSPVPFDFQINNCDTDLNSVNYTFKPASGISLSGAGGDQHLTLNSASSASGVGIQILYGNDTLVPFNTKTTFSGYIKTLGGNYTIPMKARYIRTGTITAGTANSAAEFVMSYE